MKLEWHSGSLDQVLTEVGARRSTWVPSVEPLPARGPRTIVEMVSPEGVQVGPGGTIVTPSGEHVVIYIKDHTTKANVRSDIKERCRVHLSDCRTIRRMKADNAYERYVQTNRRDDLYDVTLEVGWNRYEDTELPLLPCKNCLDQLGYKDFSLRSGPESVVESFRLAEFFDHFATKFESKPQRRGGERSEAYSPDWRAKADAAKSKVGYRCEICNVDLSAKPVRKLLDVHHRNRVKSDNQPSNLQVLCKLCHADQPNHHHYRIPREDQTEIRNLRRQQQRGGG